MGKSQQFNASEGHCSKVNMSSKNFEILKILKALVVLILCFHVWKIRRKHTGREEEGGAQRERHKLVYTEYCMIYFHRHSFI
jgi:hypothetical protein